MDKYRILAKQGEGTFSEVLKCQNLLDGSFAAVKRMKGKFNSLEQVNSLREVQALRRLNPHPNIVCLLEVVFDKPNGRLDLVCELLEMNLYERIRGAAAPHAVCVVPSLTYAVGCAGRRTHLPDGVVQSYTYQLCKALDHMHRSGIFHRDLKPENILLKGDVLKLADFGSCRGIYSRPPFTEYISTRWYRPPECLLTDGFYSFKMDLWSAGCVLFEVASLFPLFPGNNEVDQLSKIHDVLGTPSPLLLAKIRKGATGPHQFDFPPKDGTGIDSMLPQASADCLSLLNGLLAYDAEFRLSARQAMRHPFLKEQRDADKRHAHAAAAAAAAAGPSTGGGAGAQAAVAAVTELANKPRRLSHTLAGNEQGAVAAVLGVALPDAMAQHNARQQAPPPHPLGGRAILQPQQPLSLNASQRDGAGFGLASTLANTLGGRDAAAVAAAAWPAQVLPGVVQSKPLQPKPVKPKNKYSHVTSRINAGVSLTALKQAKLVAQQQQQPGGHDAQPSPAQRAAADEGDSEEDGAPDRARRRPAGGAGDAGTRSHEPLPTLAARKPLAPHAAVPGNPKLAATGAPTMGRGGGGGKSGTTSYPALSLPAIK